MRYVRAYLCIGCLHLRLNFAKKAGPAAMSINTSIFYLPQIDYIILPVLRPRRTMANTFLGLPSMKYSIMLH